MAFNWPLFLCSLFTACQIVIPSTYIQSLCPSVSSQAEVGAPGLVVGVSVDGAQVWCEGWCQFTLLYIFACHLIPPVGNSMSESVCILSHVSFCQHFLYERTTLSHLDKQW